MQKLIYLIAFLICLRFCFAFCEDFGCKFIVEEEEHFVPQNVRVGDFSETFGPVSVSGIDSISEGCKLRLCENPFFQGSCNVGSWSEPDHSGNATADSYLSGVCECPSRIKTCATQNIPKHRVCALAYLDSSCSDANGSQFVQIFERKASFPIALSHRVSSLEVRKGCALTIEGENEEGEEEVEEFNNLSGVGDRQWAFSNTTKVVASQCRCSPELLSSREDKFSLKMSGQNDVYILLIGFTGTGKSSLINFLLNNPNATATGSGESVTSDVKDLAIQVSNTSFHFIDTPGLGDTNGMQEDARTLATLSVYMNRHPVLSQRAPDLILICHKFSDNRFYGPDSQFVRTLKMLIAGGKNSFLNKAMVRPATRKGVPNVLFVFTHFTADEPEVVKNPGLKLAQFKSAIRDFAPFMPSPILKALVELKAREVGLGMVAVPEFNYVLPNGELFPQNLFQKMLSILSLEKRPALKSFMERWDTSEAFVPEVTVIPLVNRNNSLTLDFALSIAQISIGVEDSEISRELTTFFKLHKNSTVFTNLHNLPALIATVKKYLHGMGFTRKTQLPEKGSLEEYELYSGLKYSTDLETFLLLAFDFQLPILSEKGLAWNKPGSLIQLDDEFESQKWAFLRKNLVYSLLPKGEVIERVLTHNESSIVVKEFRMATLKIKESGAQLRPEFLYKVWRLKPVTVRTKWNLEGWKSLFESFERKVITCQYLGGALKITTFKDSSGNVSSIEVKGKGGEAKLVPSQLRFFKETELQDIIKRWIHSLNFPGNLVPLGICKEIGLIDFLPSLSSSFMEQGWKEKLAQALHSVESSFFENSLLELDTCFEKGWSEHWNYTSSAVEETLNQENIAGAKARMEGLKANNSFALQVKNNCERYKIQSYPY